MKVPHVIEHPDFATQQTLLERMEAKYAMLLAEFEGLSATLTQPVPQAPGMVIDRAVSVLAGTYTKPIPGFAERQARYTVLAEEINILRVGLAEQRQHVEAARARAASDIAPGVMVESGAIVKLRKALIALQDANAAAMRVHEELLLAGYGVTNFPQLPFSAGYEGGWLNELIEQHLDMLATLERASAPPVAA